jgi:hypothetical protein
MVLSTKELFLLPNSSSHIYRNNYCGGLGGNLQNTISSGFLLKHGLLTQVASVQEGRPYQEEHRGNQEAVGTQVAYC